MKQPYSFRWRQKSLALATSSFCALCTHTAFAQDDSTDPRHGEDHDHNVLEEVVVTATPIGRNAVELSQSAVVLSGDALARQVSDNIGSTLARLPGLSNASFGQNVGRPVIRGLQGGRVGVLNDGMNSFDASAVSQDHAVASEPFIADRIEVLRGPTTLLYGSGAIGGVVNIVTDVIPDNVPEEGAEGRALLQGDTAANLGLGVARLDLGAGNFAVHFNGFYRRSDDYEIPGAAELYPDDEHDHDHDDDHHGEEHEEEMTGILENSFLDNQGGSVGGAWIGDQWRFGLSATFYDSDYGIPGAHSHGHEDDHDEEHDEEHGDEEGEEENVTIGLESNRIDGLIAAQNPFKGFADLEFKISATQYTHTEFEGAEVGTVFDSDTLDMRLELGHSPWGAWEGTFGAQWFDNDFSAVGEEAFVPPSMTETAALFWVESAEFGDWAIDLGMRYEDTQIDASPFVGGGLGAAVEIPGLSLEGREPLPQTRDFQPFSISGGVVWHVSESSHLALTVARAERAPNAAELFSDGPHVATQSFEIGDPNLTIETNMHYELSWRLHQGPVTGSVTLYYDDFSDFIYEQNSGLEFEELPVYLWTQQDAEFTGGELEVRWDIGSNNAGHWQAFGFYDQVRATLANGEPVPRIPPNRFGLGMDWDRGPLAANVLWIHAAAHDRTADFEPITPGYDLVNAEFSWYLPALPELGLELFLRGENLLNDDIRNSTSFIMDQAPQIGRNFVFGIRSAF